MKTLQIIITGKVFKTGYRFFIKQLAEKYSIHGFVSYFENNKVLIEATGENNNLDKFITLSRIGCPGSVIENFQISEGSRSGDYTTMTIIETSQ